jgi:hypothetical protein
MCIGLLSGAASCTVFFTKDNGLHKGWYKNSNNPHHRNSTNPGRNKSRGKGKALITCKTESLPEVLFDN